MAGRPSLGGQAHIRVEHKVKLGDFALLRRAGVVGGEEGRVAAGGDSAGEDSGDIGDGSGEMREKGALIVDRLCLIELG